MAVTIYRTHYRQAQRLRNRGRNRRFYIYVGPTARRRNRDLQGASIDRVITLSAPLLRHAVKNDHVGSSARIVGWEQWIATGVVERDAIYGGRARE